MKKNGFYSLVVMAGIVFLASCSMFFSKENGTQGTLRISFGEDRSRSVAGPPSEERPAFSGITVSVSRNGKTVLSRTFQGSASELSLAVPYGSGYDIDVYAVLDPSGDPPVVFARAYGGIIRDVAVNKPETSLTMDLRVRDTALIVAEYNELTYNYEYYYSRDLINKLPISALSEPAPPFAFVFDSYGRLFNLASGAIGDLQRFSGGSDFISIQVPVMASSLAYAFDPHRRWMWFLENGSLSALDLTRDYQRDSFGYYQGALGPAVSLAGGNYSLRAFAADHEGYIYLCEFQNTSGSTLWITIVKYELREAGGSYSLREVRRLAQPLMDAEAIQAVDGTLVAYCLMPYTTEGVWNFIAIDTDSMTIKWEGAVPEGGEYTPFVLDRHMENGSTLPLMAAKTMAGWSREKTYIQDSGSYFIGSQLFDYQRIAELDLESGKITGSYLVEKQASATP
ncbi:hypothetical protein [Breznakiella homolactica]|uniref:Uncharacterized protein n=1 Tax=Breznakiella homolactica TaxID=2798577 RepID=A0A7T8B7X7_9SPIR|nr:hypothetical protein [Breznakiella homolactica]QQO07999.1 hypothetical protein JFL75_13735 [Breznakiella homolactica]